jgi:hypothetical protein
MRSVHRSNWPAAALLAGASSTAACSGGGEAGEDPGEHACEQVALAGTAVTAAAALADAPEIDLSDTPYTVALADDGTGVYAGFVAVHVDAETDALLFVDTADVVTGLYQDGVATTLAEPAPNALCADALPEHWDLALGPGLWQVELGPTAVDSLWWMVVSADGHAHDGDE